MPRAYRASLARLSRQSEVSRSRSNADCINQSSASSPFAAVVTLYPTRRKSTASVVSPLRHPPQGRAPVLAQTSARSLT